MEPMIESISIHVVLQKQIEGAAFSVPKHPLQIAAFKFGSKSHSRSWRSLQIWGKLGELFVTNAALDVAYEY
jgi:hypothetical protein